MNSRTTKTKTEKLKEKLYYNLQQYWLFIHIKLLVYSRKCFAFTFDAMAPTDTSNTYIELCFSTISKIECNHGNLKSAYWHHVRFSCVLCHLLMLLWCFKMYQWVFNKTSRPIEMCKKSEKSHNVPHLETHLKRISWKSHIIIQCNFYISWSK